MNGHAAGRKVDAGLDQARHTRQPGFDPAYAATTMHALNKQMQTETSVRQCADMIEANTVCRV